MMDESVQYGPGFGQPAGFGCPECRDAGKRMHSRDRANPKDSGMWWGVCDACKVRWCIGAAAYRVFHPDGDEHWQQIERRMSEYRELVQVD